jgi:hypothetical protein
MAISGLYVKLGIDWPNPAQMRKNAVSGAGIEKGKLYLILVFLNLSVKSKSALPDTTAKDITAAAIFGPTGLKVSSLIKKRPS